jgi:hypothetical protein
MLDGIFGALHVLLALAGLMSVGDGSSLALTVALIAIALTVAALLRIDASTRTARTRAHPRRAMDVSSPLSQSDPDAAGHARPRAPGRAAPAA